MIRFLQIAFVCMVLCIGPLLSAQSSTAFSLDDVIRVARDNSLSSRLAQARLANSYWQFRTYKSNYLPQISLEATLPSVNRSISTITDQNTGQLRFLPVSFMNNSAFLSVRQLVAPTGATAFLNMGLQRTDNFGLFSGTTWFSTPVSVGFEQPLLQFNPMRWERRIEPLRYEEAQRRFVENVEDLTLNAVELFFDLYTSQANLEAALTDKASADTLLVLSKGRFEVGRIAENELLQVELSVMNAEVSVARATLNVQSANEALRNFLYIRQPTKFVLSLPDSLPDAMIDPVLALEQARLNRSLLTEQARRRLEAERELAAAKGRNGVNASINAFFGLSQTADNLPDAYVSPLDQERLSLTLSVPIANWGRAEAERQVANTNLELVNMSIEQEQIAFEQNVLLRVQQFELVRSQVAVAQKSYEIGAKSFDLAQKRYKIGKIDVTDLNQAFQALLGARQNYFSGLRTFWTAWYELRRITLYDFEAGKSLVKDLPKK